MRLKGKVALVTGSSRGIGRAIALLFAEEGAKIVINYNTSKERAEKVVDEMVRKGSEAFAVKCDVSKEDEVKKMIGEVVKKFGKIDILVNNAGIVFDVPLFEKTVEQWENVLGTNLIGTFLCSKYASKHMTKGSIINISSIRGINGYSSDTADYDASKAGVIILTKSMAEELAPDVRVNSIAPGLVDTEINSDLPKDFVKEETDKIYLERFGKPEEIAKAALFLASDDSSYMTGSVLTVDGGYK